MGGFFGVTSRRDAVADVFFGTDYHSHLGTRRGGMAAWDGVNFSRDIHNIQNSPFRTKFENVCSEMSGNACIGCISDTDPQPLLIRSNLGTYAITTIGRINNAEELANQFLSFSGGHFSSLASGNVTITELVAALINQKSNFTDGIRFAHSVIDGAISILILKDTGAIIAARDKVGRLPISIGKDEDGYAVAFEDFSYMKLGYKYVRDLGPGEIAEISPAGITVLSEPLKKKRICAFLWSYYGYPNSDYEGINVEIMRTKNGEFMAKREIESGEMPEVDSVCGVPDSGTPHAIGYANASDIPFARPFIKYTPTWPRSFMPGNQSARVEIAKMKLVPVRGLINGKRLMIIDDSIVRGTQLRETAQFLYENGAKEVHVRSACPPILFGCKYLNFSRNTSDMELIARRFINELEGDEGLKHVDEYTSENSERGRALRRAIADHLHVDSLRFQSLEGIIDSIGLPADEVCTYCWCGHE